MWEVWISLPHVDSIAWPSFRCETRAEAEAKACKVAPQLWVTLVHNVHTVFGMRATYWFRHGMRFTYVATV